MCVHMIVLPMLIINILPSFNIAKILTNMKTNTADGKNLLALIFVNDDAQFIIYIHLGKHDYLLF